MCNNDIMAEQSIFHMIGVCTLHSVHDFLHIGKDVIGGPFGIDHLGVEFLCHSLSFGIVIFYSFLDGLLRIIKIVPVKKKKFKIFLTILTIFSNLFLSLSTRIVSLASRRITAVG